MGGVNLNSAEIGSTKTRKFDGAMAARHLVPSVSDHLVFEVLLEL
jgi:hypothetical protein